MILRPGTLLRRKRPLGYDFAAGLPAAWSGMYSRAGVATRVSSDGVVRYEPHNLIIYSAGPFSNWADSGADGGDGAVVDGVQTRRISAPGRYRQISGSIAANHPFTVSHYLTAVGGGVNVTLGTNSNGRTPAVINSSTGAIVSGPAGTTVSAVSGGWRVDVPYTGDGNSLSALNMPATGSCDVATWVCLGGPCQYIATQANPNYGGIRLEHDPATLAPLGLLVEGARTQLAANTDSVSAAWWTKSGCTASADAGLAPDGTMSADKYIPSNGLSNTYIYRTTLPASTGQYTSSIFAKAAGLSLLRMHAYSVEDGETQTEFNLATGAVVSGPGRIEPWGNGWYRCQLTKTWAGLTSAQVQIARYAAAGNGVDGFLLWGAQPEAGAFASSHIPNTVTSGTVTRAAGSLILTGTALSGEVGTGATGTITAAAYAPPLGSSDTAYLWESANADRSVKAGVWIDGSTMTARFGVGASSVSLGAVTAGALITVEASWGSTGMSARLNGGSVTENAATFDGASCTKLAVMSNTVPAAQLFKPMARWRAQTVARLPLPA